MSRMSHRHVVFLLAVLVAAIPLRVSGAESGEAVYNHGCASCHDSPGERTPPRAALKQLSVQRILRTLDFGVMINVAYVLNRDEREAVANFLGVQRPDPPVPPQAYCSDRTVTFDETVFNDPQPPQTTIYRAAVHRASGVAVVFRVERTVSWDEAQAAMSRSLASFAAGPEALALRKRAAH